MFFGEERRNFFQEIILPFDFPQPGLQRFVFRGIHRVIRLATGPGFSFPMQLDPPLQRGHGDPQLGGNCSGRAARGNDEIHGIGLELIGISGTGRHEHNPFKPCLTSVVHLTGLVLGVETGENLAGCPDCGVVAVGHGRQPVRLHDIPCFGRPVRLLRDKRAWRCPDQDCPRTTFTEEHTLAGPRAKLTARAMNWATDALQHFDTSVSALAHQLGVSWHTVWHGIRAEAARRIADTGRLKGVDALGVDEHDWAHTGPPGTGMVTGIVDHTRNADGTGHARLLDLVPGRSGKAYADWLKDRGAGFTAGIRTAGSVPRLRERDPDAFHVVKLGSAMVDEVRRRVQQDTLGHRGRKGDPLYGIRRTLQIGAEHPGTPRPERRSALRNPPDPADRRRTPHRETGFPARREAHRRGPGPRTHPGLAVLPEAPKHLPRPPGTRQGTRHRRDRVVPDLAYPGSRPTRPDPQTMEVGDPGLLRPTAPPTAPPKRSTASSKPPAESPEASATSPTTGSDAYSSPPAATAPTGRNKQTMPKCEGPDIGASVGAGKVGLPAGNWNEKIWPRLQAGPLALTSLSNRTGDDYRRGSSLRPP